MSADLIGALVMVTAGAATLGFGLYADRRYRASKDWWSMWVFGSVLCMVLGGAATLVGLGVLVLVVLAGGAL
jgi:hypothetical protein